MTVPGSKTLVPAVHSEGSPCQMATRLARSHLEPLLLVLQLDMAGHHMQAEHEEDHWQPAVKVHTAVTSRAVRESSRQCRLPYLVHVRPCLEALQGSDCLHDLHRGELGLQWFGRHCSSRCLDYPE